MSKQFEGQVVLVTAAASGIGAATAKAFANAGARLMLSDVNEEGLSNVVSELQAAGVEVHSQLCDCTNDQQVDALVDKTVSTFGKLDVGVNVVGGALGDARGNGPEFHSQSTEGWNDSIALTLNTSYLCMKHEITQMLKQGAGKIVNVSSMAGIAYVPDGGAAYCTAKAAIIYLTKFAAATYGDRGLRINCIAPGTTETAAVERAAGLDPTFVERLTSTQTIKRLIKPSEQADAILWLCSDSASMVTGHTLRVDGGWVS